MFCVQAHGLFLGHVLVLSRYVPRPLVFHVLSLSASPVLSPYILVFAVLCWFIVILTCVLPYFVEPCEYPVKSII